MVHIYCGDGKGKTTAATGLCVRALGNGWKVLFVQFLKAGKTGEVEAISQLDNVTILRGKGSKKFVWDMTEEEKQQTIDEHNSIFKKAMEQIADCQMIVLDEIIATYNMNMIDREAVVRFLTGMPKDLEVVMTGRDPAPELLAYADYVSEIKKVKHPFDMGVKARKGVER